MSIMLRSYCLKILLNTSLYSCCLALAIVQVQPFNRIAAALALVAARLSASLSVAQRRNIPCYSAGIVKTWITQWYPVILCKCMPQSRRSATDCTAVVPVLKTALPICSGERIGQLSFSSTTICCIGSCFQAISLSPALTGLNAVSLIALIVSLLGHLFTLRIVCSVLTVISITILAMITFPLHSASDAYFSMLLIIAAMSSVSLLWMCLVVSNGFLHVAAFATALSNASLVGCEVDRRKGFVLTTNGTTIVGKRIVDHSTSPLLHLVQMSAGGEMNRFSCSYSLADR